MAQRSKAFCSITALRRLLAAMALLLAIQSFYLTPEISITSVDSVTQNGPSSSSTNDIHSANDISDSLPGIVASDILPDGTLTFTPMEFQSQSSNPTENYINLPNHPPDPKIDSFVSQLMDESINPTPLPAEKLMHRPHAAPSPNAIVGLASYPKFMQGWKKLVGSLRSNGYEGHIIVGVHPEIPQEEREYLNKMGVTYYAVEMRNCSAAILEGLEDNKKKGVRGVCSEGLEDLKLEWGRYEMARRWLKACDTCTGWSMVIDTRDIFFQRDPFASLGDPEEAEHDLMFVEEVASYTNTLPQTPNRAINIGASLRYKLHVEPCYGKSNVAAHQLLHRPMLCSGTVLGTSAGIHRFLSVLVHEFRENNKRGPQCRSPATTDQWTMNYLYYKGRFGFHHRTKTWPWGTGPVLTVGKPCVNDDLTKIGKKSHSQKDMMVFGVGGVGDAENDLILNPHEAKGSETYVAPTLHQWDRCHLWINPWFQRHGELFLREEPVDWV